MVVPHISDLAAPLTELTKNGVEYEWMPHHDCVVQDPREALQSNLVLIKFDYTSETVLECNASKSASAAILSQLGPDRILQPMALHLE